MKTFKHLLQANLLIGLFASSVSFAVIPYMSVKGKVIGVSEKSVTVKVGRVKKALPKAVVRFDGKQTGKMQTLMMPAGLCTVNFGNARCSIN
ncbi:MAG: hypothetical protein HRT45_05255 [Bdellovibrionales bacterium]|nr:hypothetical protein [Bdellovibrionales bacterium]